MIKKKKIPINEKTIRFVSAVVLALLFWFFVNGNSNDIIPQDINSIPVTMVNAEMLQGKKLTMVDSRNYYVNLGVKGTDKSLRAIDPKEITAEIDLKDINEKGTYDLEIVVKGLSNSVILEKINPGKIQIVVDNIIESKKDVEIVTEGKPAENNVVISASSNEKVQVKGPDDRVAQVDKIVAVVNVNGIAENTTRYVEVKPYDKVGNIINNVECVPNMVKMNIAIGKTKNVMIIPPSTTGNVAPGYKVTGVSVDPTQKIVGAEDSVLNNITNLNIDPIDITEATKTITKEVQLKLPDGASFLDSTNKVNVTVSIEPLIEKSFTVNGIETRNLGGGLTAAKVKDSSIVVKVTGISSELNKLNSDTIKAFVDLNGMGKGENEVMVQVTLPSEQVKSITPGKTTVTIE
ncbi:MAG: CdaR family protein [Eubacterium sp.]